MQKKDTIIKSESLAFEYIRRDEDGNVADIVRALNDISIEIKKGTFLAILGSNGCGKSTLARHLNALLTPTEGTLWIDGKDTKNDLNTLKIRKETGMVFQNPDNQIIGTLVEEDVAFGLENLGVETAEIWNRVGKSLKKLGIERFRYSSPNKLSGGQKQKVAIAGIVAMQPKCIVLDEATAMLDPIGRKEVLEAVQELNRSEEITIILITHYMEEALYADQVLVLHQGNIVMAGTPREVFSQEDKLNQFSLEVPEAAAIANYLQAIGFPIEKGIIEEQELINALKKIYKLPIEERYLFAKRAKKYYKERQKGYKETVLKESAKTLLKPPILVMDQVCYSYEKEQIKKIKAKTEKINFHQNAVHLVSFSIYEGEFLALIGHTGSGKSTLLQMMNGLLKADSGSIYYRGKDIYDSDFSLPTLRYKVGLVFQYPEYQLFETTVVKDVMFGPKNQGLPKLQAQINTFEALKLVGIEEELFDISPFDLSGGQKRKVAIAGVLAMKPELIILDEPAAGLDPKGRKELFSMLKTIREQTNTTVFIVSHSMEDVANYADRVLVMKEGELLFDDIPKKVFSYQKELKEISLDIPKVAQIIEKMQQEGILIKSAYTLDQAIENIIDGLN